MSEITNGTVAAWHYDGRSAVRHRVRARIGDGALTLIETGETVPLERLRPAGDHRIPAYGLIDQPGWRIEFAAPIAPEFQALLPGQEKHGRLMDRFGVKLTIGIGAMLAVAALYLFAVGSAAVARLIPIGWEVAMGNMLSDRVEKGTCGTPAGRAALDRLVGELHPEGPPIRVAVVDLPVVNAVTLPGRQILLFRGLLDQARSPDELAGVLAHEIGHVEHRDAMIALLRGYGLSLLLGGADGGAVMQTLISNRYSRGAERAADSAAIEALQRANISARATAGFFDRLSRREPGGMGADLAVALLSTHPLSGERRQAFLDAAEDNPRPALSPVEWRELKTGCAAKQVTGR